MRRMEIREKLIPYSHLPGTKCLVPCSDWIVEVFPALLRIAQHGDVLIGVTGPLEQFLVQMDLERDCVWVTGHALEGFYCFSLKANNEGLWLMLHRAPKEGLVVQNQRLGLKERLLLARGGKIHSSSSYERVSFGSNKKQDWDLVCRRNDAREMMPLLFLAGQKVPSSQVVSIQRNMKMFFRSGILMPDIAGLQHLGIFPQHNLSADPMAMLHSCYRTIRENLFREEESSLHILPEINEIPVGRAHLRASFGAVFLEWSQAVVKKMVIEPFCDFEKKFVFSKEVASFRMHDKRFLNEAVIACKAKEAILFDRFQK